MVNRVGLEWDEQRGMGGVLVSGAGRCEPGWIRLIGVAWRAQCERVRAERVESGKSMEGSMT